VRISRLLLVCAVAILISGCTPGKPGVTIPPLEVGTVPILPLEQYATQSGAASPGLAYVARDGRVMVRDPWYSSAVPLGEAEPWSAPGWGYDPDYNAQGRPVARHKLIFVAPDSRIMQYDVSSGQTQELPLDARGVKQIQASYTPSGEFVVVDEPRESPPRLLLFRPQTAEKLWEVTYATRWVWSPYSEWLALDSSRRIADSIATSDLAVFSAAENSTRVVIPGDTSHSWQPVGWASGNLLAYVDTKDPGGALHWVDVRTGDAPSNAPVLGLAWDRDRVARLVPENLADSWTGQYAVSATEDLIAIVCGKGEDTPTVYVTSLSDGRWFLLATGERVAWMQYPRREWSD